MMKEFLEQLEKEVKSAWCELIDLAALKATDLVVLGCSSSEIIGKSIGQDSSLIVGHTVIKATHEVLDPLGINLATQCCEHLNRALIVERTLAEGLKLQQVFVVPAQDAGGSAAVAAYAQAKDPVLVSAIEADAGLDIGDTFIGMHVRHVQIPQRLTTGTIGRAHLSALKSRLPRIGGERAKYSFDRIAYDKQLADSKE